MKTVLTYLIIVAGFGLVSPARANILVNNTWKDGDRTDPAAPQYAENNGVVGTDADADGDLESLWYRGGTGTALNTVPGGPMSAVMGTSSGSFTTYFTPAAGSGLGAPVTLNNAGDSLTVTWKFTPRNVNAGNTSQAFPLAVALTPTASRLAADGSSPSSAAYLGYAMYMNMGQTLGNSNPFQLKQWASPGSANNFLSTSAAWTGVANGATSGNHGYDSDTQYTYVMSLTRNALGGLDIVSTMTGGNLNGAGFATVSYTDAAHSQGYAFDTFGFRPSTPGNTGTQFDTSLFKVEFTPIPEPSTFALAGLALALFARCRKHR
jgi:hypothetical protein